MHSREEGPSELRRPERAGKRGGSCVLRKFFFLKRAHGLNHKGSNISEAKLSNSILTGFITLPTFR